MAGKAASGVAGAVSKLLKKPWEFTGPASSPEFLESLVKAGEYRPLAPTNPPAAVSIPTAETDRIYDIKYFPRDGRRLDLAPRTEQVPLSALAAEAAALELPPTAGTYFQLGTEFPVEDAPGGGYQK